MRLIFCGTPQFAVPTLKHLLGKPDFEVIAVITQPDRPRGRGRQLSVSPVKEVALAANLPVHQPEKIRAPEVQQLLEKVAPDVIAIIAYGQIVPARLLAIPKHGWINLHASLLPKYRGAAPLNWVIANGETRSGLTTMRIDAGMDTGDLILQQKTPIAPDETTPQLAERLAKLGASLMVDSLRGLQAETLTPKAQDHSAATFARLLKKEDGLIDWRQSAQVIYNRMRGFTPWPGAYAHFRASTCHLFGEPVSNLESAARPGTILYDGREFIVACGQQSFFRVSHVKQEGRKQVSAIEFANGSRLQSGEQFGEA